MTTGIPTAIAFERIPVIGLLLDLDGTVLAVNRAARVALEREASELVGQSLGAVFHTGGDPLLRRTGDSHELQVEVAGRRRTLHCAVAESELEGRTILQVFGLDISARADAEEQSSAKQRLESLGIVAGGIAHDFNNLLVGVLAESSAAREDETLPESTREALRRIEAAAQRMALLTRLMLAYAGRGQYVSQRLDPDDLVRELREVLVRSVRTEVAFDVQTAAGAVVIEADPAQLRQVVINLATNASDAGGGHVRISTRILVRHNQAWWQLEVSDDGCGIDASTIGRIFEPFFTTKPDRHGLGLSAVHGIVRRLGGDIDVDSSPGNGARFRVRIPVLPGAEAQRRLSTEGGIPSAMLADVRVLVADDEPSVRATVRRLLERRGATVVLATDGSEAEDRLRLESFDLVILDVSMPGRGGYDVLVTARELHPGVPVVLMSGFTHRVRGEGGEEEPDAFLEKPFTARSLDGAIDAVMRRKL